MLDNYAINLTNGVCRLTTAKQRYMIFALIALITDALCFPSDTFRK